MKRLFLILVLAYAPFLSYSQSDKTPEVTTLIAIIEQGDFNRFQKLVTMLGYIVLDSSREKNGSLFYYSRDFKYHGNVLACSTDPKLKITELTFITFNKEIFKTFKAKFQKLDFKSTGVHKGEFSDIIESEDFEKGKTVIATAIRKKKDEDPLYEFTFIFF